MIAIDHYLHKLAFLAVGLYAWQLHGWLLGLSVVVGLFVVIPSTNLAVMAVASEKSVLQLVRINRWFWIVCTAMVLALSAATIENV